MLPAHYLACPEFSLPMQKTQVCPWFLAPSVNNCKLFPE
jgi:hypothetical protein